ncbi:MAG: TIGR01777 family oxidoreductase [Bacteroidia bacterium]|nr:TIGR01777 family oxidoreductase [Bacteroidia bacterium]
MKQTVLITGGTGLVGNHLSKLLLQKGHQVKLLGRNEGRFNNLPLYKWDIDAGFIDPKAFEGVDTIVHLAGAGIADKRWTDAYKSQIYNSRILSTRLLAKTLSGLPHSVKNFVSTSATGWYGLNTPEATTEELPAAPTFLGTVCRDWEAETYPIQQSGIRTTILRVGVVFAKESGFIPEVAKPVKLGIGAALASGKQLTSWIHIDDLCQLYAKAITDPTMQGIYNAVTPHPETNQQLTTLIAQQLNKPLILPPVPKWVLKILFGEVADMLAANQWISAQKIQQTGFTFEYPKASDAIGSLLHHTK